MFVIPALSRAAFAHPEPGSPQLGFSANMEPRRSATLSSKRLRSAHGPVVQLQLLRTERPRAEADKELVDFRLFGQKNVFSD